MISAGKHIAVATGHDFGKTSTGKNQVAVKFEILEGPDAGNHITWYGYFSEKTFDRTCESLRFCGWKGTDLMNLGQLNQKVQLVIEHSEYQGKTSAKVQWVNRLSTGDVQLKDSMSEDDLRLFAAKVRDKAAKIPEVEGERVFSDSMADEPTEDELGF